MKGVLCASRLGATLLMALLSGCASVLQSTPVGATAEQPGMVYALPKAQVQLVAQRKRVDNDDVARIKKEAAETEAAAAAAKAPLTAAKAALADAKAIAERAATNPALADATKARLQHNEVVAKAVLDVMTTRKEVADAAAKAAKAAAEGASAILGTCQETATLAALAHAADAAARFIAVHDSSIWRDDQLTVSLTPAGLLNSSTAVAADQTGAVLLSLAQAFAAAKVPSNLGPTFWLKGKAGAEPPKTQDCNPYRTSLVFDPSREAELMSARDHLAKAGSNLGLCVDGLAATGVIPKSSASLPGYAYRAARSLQVTVSGAPINGQAACKPSDNEEAATLVVQAPDATTLFVAPVQAAAFTKVSTKHTFKDGMLVEMSLDKPSVAAAVASLPVEILKALVSIPASILKLRVDYETQSAAVTTQQANVLKAQLDLLNAQKALEDKLSESAAGP